MKYKIMIASLALGLSSLFNPTAALAAKKKPAKAKIAHVQKKSVKRLATPIIPTAKSTFVCVRAPQSETKIATCDPLTDPTFSSDIDRKAPPASLTKIETAYYIYKHMKISGKELDDPFVTITAKDNYEGRLGEREGEVKPMGGHVIPFKPGTTLSYRESIYALTAWSANNVAVAAAKKIAPDGKESTFARMMTADIRRMGLTETTFKNASGMPATGQVTTAREIAILVNHIVTELGTETFGMLYGQHNKQGSKPLTIGGITKDNIIPLFRDPDLHLVGAKTGTQNEGLNIATYTERNGVGAVTVVMGSPNKYARNQYAINLIRRAFDMLATPAHASPLPSAAMPSKVPADKVAAAPSTSP